MFPGVRFSGNLSTAQEGSASGALRSPGRSWFCGAGRDGVYTAGFAVCGGGWVRVGCGVVVLGKGCRCSYGRRSHNAWHAARRNTHRTVQTRSTTQCTSRHNAQHRAAQAARRDARCAQHARLSVRVPQVRVAVGVADQLHPEGDRHQRQRKAGQQVRLGSKRDLKQVRFPVEVGWFWFCSEVGGEGEVVCCLPVVFARRALRLAPVQGPSCRTRVRHPPCKLNKRKGRAPPPARPHTFVACTAQHGRNSAALVFAALRTNTRRSCSRTRAASAAAARVCALASFFGMPALSCGVPFVW